MIFQTEYDITIQRLKSQINLIVFLDKICICDITLIPP